MKLFKDEPFKDVQQLGTKDGAYDQDHARDFVIMKHGPRPVMRPADSLEQALWLEASDTTRLNQWTAELLATEDEIVKHLPAWMLLGLLGVVGIAEFEALILFWRDRGVTGFTRIVVAIASAITTVFLPWILVELGNKWKENK
jgi:hypothetical protein